MEDDTKFNRCKETILYGSLYEAFYSNFVTIEDVLEYFLKYEEKNINESQDVKNRNIIAYRIVCIFSKEQKIRGTHFINLTKNEDFIIIYTFTYPSSLAIFGNTDEKNFEILEKTQKIIPKLIQNLPRIYELLFSLGIKKDKYSREDAFIICMIRNVFFLPDFSIFYKAFIGSDYLDPLENIPFNNYVSKLADRALFLKEKVPLYWKHVASPLYFSFLQNKVENPTFSQELIKIYDELFPNLFNEKIKNRRLVVSKLLNMNKYKQAYYLGFPIHEYIPNEKNIQKTLDKLQEIGIEKYCKEISENNLNLYKYEKINKQNVNYDDIEDFNSFDIIYYCIDQNNSEELSKVMFLFSRPEFEKLLKTNKNFYTQETLPEFVKVQIKARQKIAKKYNLPKSKILLELLNSLEDNNEEDDEDDEDVENEDDDEDVEDVEDIEDNRGSFIRIVNRETGEENILTTPFRNFEINTDTEDEILEDILSQEGYDYLGREECYCYECEKNQKDQSEDL